MSKYTPWILLIIPIYFAITVCCAQSLNPIYTEDDIIYDPALIGTFQDEDEAIMAFRQHDSLETTYVLTLTNSDGYSGEFVIVLVDIEGYMFLDFYPIPNEQTGEDLSQYLSLPTHGFLRVDQIEPDLILRSMDVEWLTDYLQNNPNALEHVFRQSDWPDEPPIITASTEEYQAFIVEHIDTEGAYGDPLIYSRLVDTDEESITDE